MAGRPVRVVVTAGPTREHIDPVRFIGNASSGAMGYAIAAHLRDAGFAVTLVTGPAPLAPPSGTTVVRVTSAAEMERAVLAAVRGARALVMAAAVGDWRPARRSAAKIKRKRAWSLRLVPTPDILARVARTAGPGLFLAGFALETENAAANARAKLAAKGADMIVANTTSYIGTGGRARSEVSILRRDGSVERLGVVAKETAARRVARAVAEAVRREPPGAAARRRPPCAKGAA